MSAPSPWDGPCGALAQELCVFAHLSACVPAQFRLMAQCVPCAPLNSGDIQAPSLTAPGNRHGLGVLGCSFRRVGPSPVSSTGEALRPAGGADSGSRRNACISCFRNPDPERDGVQAAAPGHGGLWPRLHGRSAEPHLQYLHPGKASLLTHRSVLATNSLHSHG